MKKVLIVIFLLSLFLLSGQSLANETAAINLKVQPLSGSTLYQKAYTPVNWKLETAISTDAPSIRPMIEADMHFPAASSMTFNPTGPVCPDSKIGPGIDPGPIQDMIDLCRGAVLGHGSARFALNRINIPSAILDGYMAIFNGGLVDGQAKIKVTAWSFDTSAGIYTEGVLGADGRIVFPIPRLSSDSAVISLNLEIPARDKRVFVEKQGYYITLPGGRDRSYVRAKCSSGLFPVSGNFLLGSRTGTGTIIDSILVPASTEETCVGKTGPAKLVRPTASGPGSAKSGKRVNYKVTLKNSGAEDAKSIVLVASGRGVSGKVRVPKMMPATTKTVKLPVVFKKKGKVTVAFKARASGIKAVTTKKTVRVR